MKYSIALENHPTPARQKGAALIIGLVLLISLTIVGVGVLSTTSLEQRMAGNMTDLNLAFNCAETAGRAFSNEVSVIVGDRNSICKNIGAGCISENLELNWWQDADQSFWTTNAINLGDNLLKGKEIKGVKQQPQLVVEPERFATYSQVRGTKYNTPGIHFIRLTSRCTGASNNTEVVIQQIVTKQK